MQGQYSSQGISHMAGRGASVIPLTSSDQWMIEVLADLQESARERGMTSAVDQLARASDAVKNEIVRKRVQRDEAARRPQTAKYASIYNAVPPSERRH